MECAEEDGLAHVVLGSAGHTELEEGSRHVIQ